MYRRSALAVLATLALVACSDNDVTNPESELDPAFTAGNGRAGAVYTMTNSATENEVLVYGRSTDGTPPAEPARVQGSAPRALWF
jgi:hypothetical protein